MMTREQVETATREQLADELAAACQATEGWQTMPIDELRAAVREQIEDFATPEPFRTIRAIHRAQAGKQEQLGRFRITYQDGPNATVTDLDTGRSTIVPAHAYVQVMHALDELFN